ncbi:MAG: hypothetical protein GY850_37580, partial [bacterium]|nr:hypothetical protein [bacterium]
GNHGRTITLKRFKGMVILACLVLCVSIAITAGLLYLSLNIRSDKIQLESDLKDLKAQIKALRYEKDVLLTKLVLAESHSKQSPLKKTPQSSEPETPQQESVVDEKTVQTVPSAGIQEKPRDEEAPEPAPTDGRAESGLSVAIENFKIYPEADENLLRVQFKIKNTSPNAKRVAGHTIVVLKGEQLRQNQWLTIPRILLSNGKPTGRQRGHLFGISNFKTMRFKTNLPKSPEVYRDASVFIFTQKGDLLLEKNFPVNLPALPPVAALKPPLKTPSAPPPASSSRSFSGAPAISSTKPPSASTDTSLSPSTAVPPSTDELMNTLKDTTKE